MLQRTFIKTYFCEGPMEYRYIARAACLLLFALLIIVMNPHYLNHGIPDMDEIWNYQYARRILYGQIPYRDFGVLQTPFAMQLNALFLSVFGDGLIVMRWVASVAAALNGLIAYRILITTGKNELMSLAYTAFFLCPFLLYPKNNYSWFVVLFLSMALLLELKKINAEQSKQVLYEFWIGIALGVTLITKQNIGAAALLVSSLCLLYFYKDRGSGYLIRSLGLKMLGFALAVGAEICYLGLNMNIIWMFKDMAANLTTFAGSTATPYGSIFSENLIFSLLALLVPLIVLTSFVRGVTTKEATEKKSTILVSAYAFANLAMIYPISDSVHLIFGMPMSVLGLSMIFQSNVNDLKSSKVIVPVTLLSAIAVSVFVQQMSSPTKQYTPELKHYESINIPAELRQSIRNIDTFIIDEEERGRSVHLINYQAAFYLIPLDKFSRRYDTVGAGSPAEQEIIKKLAETDKVTVIIKGPDSDENWQETKKIEEYVRETMNYSTSLHGFDVYTK